MAARIQELGEAATSSRSQVLNRWRASGTVVLLLLLGIGTGFASVAPRPYLVAALSVAVVAGFLLVGRGVSAKVVALYWITFCLFSTMLTEYVVGGMFNVLNLMLLLSVVAQLFTGKLKVDAKSLWLFGLLLAVIIQSLVGYTGSVGGIATDRLLFVPLGALAMLGMSSNSASKWFFGSTVVSSAAVAIWVVASALSTDFAYRASVGADQNVVSLFIGIGLAVCISEFLGARYARFGPLYWVGLVLLLGVMGYSLALLASRGAVISLGLLAIAAVVRLVAITPRSILRFGLLLMAIGSVFLLPGASGILERFQDASTETGSGRVQIWEAVISSAELSDLPQLLLGRGMLSSAELLQGEFTYYTSTHNSYLFMLFDYGLLGFTLFLALHLLILIRAWRTPTRTGTTVILVLVFQMGVGFFITASDSYLYWLSMGALLGIVQATD